MGAHGHLVNWGKGYVVMIEVKRSKVKREVGEWSKTEVKTKSVPKGWLSLGMLRKFPDVVQIGAWPYAVSMALNGRNLKQSMECTSGIGQ